MILDRLLQFSSNQTVGTTQTTVPSSDTIDFGLGVAANPQIPTPAQGGGVRDMGIGDAPALKLLVQMSEGLGSSTPGVTLQVLLQGAPDDGTGAPDSFVTWWSSPAYTAAEAVAGARLLDMDFPRPPAGDPVPRFVRLAYVLAAQNPNAGLINASIVIDRDDQMYNGSNNAVQGGYRPGIAVQN